MIRTLLVVAAIALNGCAVVPDGDAPDSSVRRLPAGPHPDSYQQALESWRSPEQLNTWIMDTFEYDRVRATRLSETQRQAQAAPAIYPPAQFFSRPVGVCVDLARFAVETLQAIAPELRPKYLTIEFSPVTIDGNTLRRHWMASFEREGKLYFFADSRRPGFIAGPYVSTSEFVQEYALYRGREVTSFQELSSHQRRVGVKSVKQPREEG
jgi:hypothetical protein